MKNTKILTKEQCVEIVKEKKYSSTTDLSRRNHKLWRIMRDNGWLKDCFDMSSKVKGVYNTKEECFTAVKDKGYTRIVDLQRGWYGMYKHLAENGWLEECFDSIDFMTQWPIEKVAEWLKDNKIKTRKEFWEKASGLYNIVLKKNWMDELFEVNPNKVKGVYNTKEECYAEIERRKYKTVYELQQKWSGMYKFLKDNNWLESDYWVNRWIPTSELHNVSPIFNRLLADKNYAYKASCRMLQYMAEAEGIRNPFGGKIMRKLANTLPDSNERKTLVDALTGDDTEMVENEIASIENEETENNEVSNEVMTRMDDMDNTISEVMSDDEVDKKVEMLRKDREVVHNIMKNPAMFNIVNTGDILKSMMEYMVNQTMRVYLAAGDKKKKEIKAEFSC